MPVGQYFAAPAVLLRMPTAGISMSVRHTPHLSLLVQLPLMGILYPRKPRARKPHTVEGSRWLASKESSEQEVLVPIYEYECTKCSSRFELKKRFGENSGASCPHCQGKARRVFSAVLIFFKGPGFYVTDKSTGWSWLTSGKDMGRSANGEKESVSSEEPK